MERNIFFSCLLLLFCIVFVNVFCFCFFKHEKLKVLPPKCTIKKNNNSKMKDECNIKELAEIYTYMNIFKLLNILLG